MIQAHMASEQVLPREGTRTAHTFIRFLLRIYVPSVPYGIITLHKRHLRVRVWRRRCSGRPNDRPQKEQLKASPCLLMEWFTIWYGPRLVILIVGAPVSIVWGEVVPYGCLRRDSHVSFVYIHWSRPTYR